MKLSNVSSPAGSRPARAPSVSKKTRGSTGAPHVLALTSATAGLHPGLLALDLKTG